MWATKDCLKENIVVGCTGSCLQSQHGGAKQRKLISPSSPHRAPGQAGPHSKTLLCLFFEKEKQRLQKDYLYSNYTQHLNILLH